MKTTVRRRDLDREAPVGEVGRCTFAESEQIFLGQRLFQYRPDPALLDWNFLAFALQSPQVQNKLQGLSFGATVPHIKVGDAEHFGDSIPPLLTQQAIGACLLAAYDDLIENNQTRISLPEESARLLYREWSVSFRYPGHTVEMSTLNFLKAGGLDHWQRWQKSIGLALAQSTNPKRFSTLILHLLRQASYWVQQNALRRCTRSCSSLGATW
ncbi:MAG: restriction endonuclease subunit S [Burkholderiales bacterium]|nr:restriction endonuclease subunit S [Burkholderiales bacterium]